MLIRLLVGGVSILALAVEHDILARKFLGFRLFWLSNGPSLLLRRLMHEDSLGLCNEGFSSVLSI